MAETDSKAAGRRTIDVPDLDAMVRPAEGAYMEREDHVPNPHFQYGQLDTSDTAGGANNSVNEISPVFHQARVQNLVTAARALDPDDHEVPAELVVLPEGSVTVQGTARTPDDAMDDIEAALGRYRDNPVEFGGMTREQKLAAESSDEGSDDNGAEVSAEREREREGVTNRGETTGETDTSTARHSTPAASSRRASAPKA